MSRFILHKKAKEKICLKYLMTGIACILTAGAVCFAVHSIGTARAKSHEVVLIYTQEELEQYLLNQESEEYNRNGRYCLEADLDLGGLYQSIGTNTEPFTGTFDGNGHVISGLARPLFGVMEHARVENLFLSETVMTAPFTYYDGERYVDGYGALAAYAVDSVIQNCGMSGGIWTASPAETEFQLAKASPAEAEEGGGPGMADDVFMQPDDEIPQENTGTAGPANDIMDDSTTASEASDGPGAEISSAESQETAGSEETKESGGAESGSQEESPSGSGQSGSGDAGNITLPEDSESASEEAGVPSETETADGEQTEPTEENTVETSEAEGGGENIPEAGDGSEETSKLAGGTENTSSGSEPAGGTDMSLNHDGTDPGTSAPVDSGPKGESAAAISETIGYRVMERRHLMMKIPAVLDSDAEAVLKASPSDATPSDAEDPVYDEADASKENQTGSEDETMREETEDIEYIGNPNGDIYILVTADRVTAGGLIAQTSGTTLISDCFALVEMGSHLEAVETYAGGFAGIIGVQTRIGNSYTSGLADSDDVTGGFAAVNDGIIENSYSSMSVGTAGTIRDAFTALGSGSLSGCVYDRQMACAEAAKEEMTDHENMEMEQKDTTTPADAKPALSEEADFSLKGQNTADMTGPEAQIPGNWYRTANAYPQIEHFALNDHDLLVANSRASAIALLLPDGVTLVNILSEGEITLPSDVDGQQIEWNAEGGIGINESNQVVVEAGASISSHDAPEVGSALEPPSAFSDAVRSDVTLNESSTELSSEPAMEAQTELHSEPKTELQTEPEAEQPASENASSNFPTDGMKLKASINGITKNYVLAVSAPRSTGYTTWYDVGQAMIGSGIAGYEAPLLVDGYYEIWNGTQLAWFAAKVNQGNTGWNARLMADINLFGREHNNYAGDPVLENITNAMIWTPIGNTTKRYAGTFDGNCHEVDGLYLNGGNGIGLFGWVKGANIKNLGVGVNSFVTSTVSNCALFIGASDVSVKFTLTNCYNLGTIGANIGHAGAFLGDDSGAASRKTGEITYCFNGGNTPMFADLSHGQISKCFADVSTYERNGRSENNFGYTQDIKLITTKDLAQSWAISYALNGENMDGVWKYTAGEYPGFGTLDPPVNWEEIGKGMEAGLLTKEIEGDGGIETPYLLDSGEELAWFAYYVNSGNTASCGKLTADVNLFGSKYVRWSEEETLANIEHALQWKPIGVGSQKYDATFDGGGHEVDGLYIGYSGENMGLFGITYAPTIKNLGIGMNSLVSSTGAWRCGLLVGAAETYRNTLIENCYNLGTVSTGSGGAFMGDDIASNGGKVYVRNCFNAGNSLKFAHINSGVIENCYADTTVCATNNIDQIGNKAMSLTTTQMKSWAAAYALNNQKMVQDGGVSWTYDPTGQKYPRLGTLPKADWEQVAQGMVDKLVKKEAPSGSGTSSSPYQIGNAEQLAWFAWQVNHGADKGLTADLTGDIGSMAGDAYGGDINQPVPWIPIEAYSGTFGANHAKVYQLTDLSVNITGNAGLFGGVAGGSISSLGIANSSVTGNFAGGIAGRLQGNAVISRCYNRSENSGTSRVAATGAAGARAGGIAGQVENSARVEDSYSLDLEITGAGSNSSIGGIAGGISTGGSSAAIQNCYRSGGTITGADGTGAITGTAGTIAQCYSDGVTAAGGGQNGTVVAVADMKKQEQTDQLNTLPDGTERMKNTGRVWYTSLSSEATRGLPTLEAPVMMEVSVSLAEITPSDTVPWQPANVTGGTGPIPADAVLRAVHQENSSSAAFTLTGTDVVKTKMNTYGYTPANSNLGLLAGTVDLQTLEAFASLTDPVAEGTLGSFSQMTLYHAAAYTEALPRAILVDLSSGNTRYEVRVAVPGITGKMLSVVLPTKVPVTLTPDGTYHKTFSENLKLVNDNAYPMEGRILSVTSIEKTGYVTLPPVERDIILSGRKGQITDDNVGVALGIANPDSATTPALPSVLSADLYYKPKAAGDENRWISYNIRNSGTFWFRYFMEYQADPYYRQDLNNYGYTVNYQFGVAENEYTSGNEAVVIQ